MSLAVTGSLVTGSGFHPSAQRTGPESLVLVLGPREVTPTPELLHRCPSALPPVALWGCGRGSRLVLVRTLRQWDPLCHVAMGGGQWHCAVGVAASWPHLPSGAWGAGLHGPCPVGVLFWLLLADPGSASLRDGVGCRAWAGAGGTESAGPSRWKVSSMPEGWPDLR